MNQSTLDFAFSPSYLQEDFVVSAANEQAYLWVTGWPSAWPHHTLLLYGAAGAGKTHLAHIWQELSGAAWLDVTQIGLCSPVELLQHHAAWIIEVPVLEGKESAWFHLLNHAHEERKWLLITSQKPLGTQALQLPDLTSRIAALPAVTLYRPDDTLLAAILAKRFSDAQLKVTPEVMQYLISRMERSYNSTEEIVNRLNRLSLVEKKNITLSLARKIVETQ